MLIYKEQQNGKAIIDINIFILKIIKYSKFFLHNHDSQIVINGDFFFPWIKLWAYV